MTVMLPDRERVGVVGDGGAAARVLGSVMEIRRSIDPSIIGRAFRLKG